MSICNCKTNSNDNTGKLTLAERGGVYYYSMLCEYKPPGLWKGGGSLTSIDPFCYMKTSHNRGLNNSELNFCICLSFLSVAMCKCTVQVQMYRVRRCPSQVQMYRVYYQIVFKRLRQHPLTTKLVIGALSWLMLTRV